MKQITNLNLVDSQKLILTDEDKIYFVDELVLFEDEGTCGLSLIEINEHFSKLRMTTRIACDKDYFFTSVKDKEMTYKFYELDITKKEIASMISKEVREKIDKALKNK